MNSQPKPALLAARVDADLARQARAAAKREKTSTSAVVRTALSKHLSRPRTWDERVAHARHEAAWREGQGLPPVQWVTDVLAQDAAQRSRQRTDYRAALKVPGWVAPESSRKTTGTGAAHPLRAPADPLAGLTDFERADAAKIKNPDARARFVAARLKRKAKRQASKANTKAAK